jgi:hypothetical protein
MLIGLWFIAMLVAGYSGGHGAGFGNAMLLQCALVPAAWWMHPSALSFAWLAAQRLRLRRMEVPA